jgi:cell division protein YceG involved in septum cleavage
MTNIDRINKRIKERKQRQQRIKTFLFTIITITMIVCLFVNHHNEQERNYHYNNTTTYYVSQGETLWSIAKQFSNNKQDIRKVIYEIELLSECNANLQIGQELTIPIYTVLQNTD